jgi:hypothetical protein
MNYNPMQKSKLMGNLAFTLYEVLGYLLPGGVTFFAFIVIYWALFVPGVPPGIASFQVGPVTWTAAILVSYILGHAAQAVGNLCFHGVESTLLAPQNGSAPKWMRERARQTASEILKVNSDQLNPRWIFSTLDEYAVQTGKLGDRDLFVYREGFYRGTLLSLFFLSAAILVRMFVPSASIMFTKGLSPISRWELFTTAAVISGIGYLFLNRYKRFAEYRVTQSVIAAIVIHTLSLGRISTTADHTPSIELPPPSPGQTSQTRPTEANGKTTLP